MRERLKEQARSTVGRWIVSPALAASIGIWARFDTAVAFDVSNSVFEWTSRFGRPLYGHAVMRFLLPTRVREEVDEAEVAGRVVYASRHIRRSMFSLQEMQDRRN